MSDENKPNWKEWKHMPEVQAWQACALLLDIEPNSIKRNPYSWMTGPGIDQLFEDGDHLTVGKLSVEVLHTPGHTPACMSYVVGDAVFVGDTLFMPDGGTARADFPGGDARELFRTIQKIFSLPDAYRIFVCHDYCPNGRNVEYQTSVEDEKRANIHVNNATSEDEFVHMRETRDKTLGMPQLILPSLQVNMRAGHLPEAEETGQVFLKLPVNAFK